MVASTNSDPGDLGPDDESMYADPSVNDPGNDRVNDPGNDRVNDPGNDPGLVGRTRTLTPEPTPIPDPVHALPTQHLPRKKSQTDSQHTKYSSTTSPAQAMRLDEIARTQIFLKVAIMTSVAGVIAALVTGGDPVAFRVVMAGCITTIVGCGWMMWATRDAGFTPVAVALPAAVIGVGAMGGVYYWGVASPVAAMITYGIYFFSLGSHVKITTAMYILVASLHGAMILLVAAGVIADRGIVSMANLRLVDQIGVLLVVEFLYFITFYTARRSQRVTLEHVSRLEQAVRGVAQREALLAEARAELDRALKVGGPGRYTDQTIGSFRLGMLIGRGGMGEVYEARGPSGEAAVKLLHQGTLSDRTSVARFIREAQVASRLDTPFVVRVLEVGTTAGEIPYLAMERLRGHDLAHQLRRQRRLKLDDAQIVADHVAQGLEAARVAGIVHRDLKPHNVFFAQDGRWKILDFGVSKAGGTGTLTKGHVIGTPAYMAPEQARGEDVDHRADVYSLAAILYRAITGHPAFTGKDVPTTLYDVVYRVPTQPSLLISLPADIDRVLALGLAKNASDRFASAIELAAWFHAALRENLSPAQRRRADDLVAKHPWGTRQAG
jgi:serine/threonine-protein kinase